MATIELSIDLGSKFITIYQKGIGLVLREPAIAIATKVRNRLEIRDAGYRAESVMTGSLGGARVIAPIKEGIIVDEGMATMLLAYFLKKIMPEGLFAPRVKAIVSICESSSSSDRRAVEKCCLKAGIKEVTLVESGLSLLAYTNSIGGLFVDIGGGKTEISAVTNHGIATGCSVNIAGDAFNNAIIDDLYRNYGVKVGEFTIENLKNPHFRSTSTMPAVMRSAAAVRTALRAVSTCLQKQCATPLFRLLTTSSKSSCPFSIRLRPNFLRKFFAKAYSYPVAHSTFQVSSSIWNKRSNFPSLRSKTSKTPLP